MDIEIPAGFLPLCDGRFNGVILRGDEGFPDEVDGPGREKLSELPGVSERRLWGTDVYTDDSDLLAVLVHSAWIRPVTLPRGYSGRLRPAADLEVKLRIAPKLIRYVSTERGGIRSRGWGNGHDGVSIVIENVRRIKVSVCSVD